MAREPGTRLDRYELLDHLADGAQAEVHRARDTRTGEVVAIKIPHQRVLQNPELARRWRRELALTEGLVHPHLACRHAVDGRHSEPYLVLDYAGGGSLDNRVGPGLAPLPIDQVVDWLRQLAQALAHLHAAGIVHGDVKTANLLLTDDLDLKLGDYGAATADRRARWWDLPTPPEGTPEYLSPEQVLGQAPDARSDIYSWGVVAYELLTGQVPLTGPTPLAAMEAHLSGSVAPISAHRPDVPPGLEAVVLRSLRRLPDDRYPDVEALQHDVDHLDRVDPSHRHGTPDPPLAGVVGGSPMPALLRLVAAVTTACLTVAAAAIALTALLH